MNDLTTNRDISIISILEYFLGLFIILQCRSVFAVTSDKHFSLEMATLIITIFLFLASFPCFKATSRLFIGYISFLGFYLIYLGIFYYIDVKSVDTIVYSGFFVMFFPIALFYSLFISGGFLRLLTAISNIVCLIAIISLFFWIFASQLHVLHPTGYYIIDWGYQNHVITSYYNLYFEPQNIVIAGKTLIRNCGIFAEGPIFNLHLILALIIELFLNSKHSKKKILLLCVTVLTTITYTGVILIVILLILFIITNNYFGLSKKNIVSLALEITLCLVGLILVEAILSSKTNTASYSIRIDDVSTALRIFPIHPLFGLGFRNYDAMNNYISFYRIRYGQIGFSNSLMIILSQGGLYFLLFYIMSFVSFVVYAIKKHNFNLLIYSVTLILLLWLNSWEYTYMVLLFLSQGYSYLLKGRKARTIVLGNNYKDKPMISGYN